MASEGGVVRPWGGGAMSGGPLALASDQRLVDRVQAGSQRAFEVLFDRHHRPILAFCRHMLGSPQEAEDAVQQTFLAAYHELVGCARPVAVRPWLYGIARHRCLSALRARREHPVDQVPETATDRLSAEVATRDDLRAVLADIARLPEDQRAALVLAELGDLSHEEIGRILECPREKVKALVFQARASLAATRDARETPCAEIRAQLATLRGGALRRRTLRRHLRECDGCRAFRDELRAQRRKLAVLLPVAPTATLRDAVLGAALGSGGTVGAVAGGVGATGLVATALVTVAVPIGGAATVMTASGAGEHGPPAATTLVRSAPRAAATTADGRRHTLALGHRALRARTPAHAAPPEPSATTSAGAPATAEHATPANPAGAAHPSPAADRSPSARPTTGASPTPPTGTTTPASPTPAARPTTPATSSPPTHPTTRPAPTPPSRPTTAANSSPPARPTTPANGSPPTRPSTAANSSPPARPTTPANASPPTRPDTPNSPPAAHRTADATPTRPAPRTAAPRMAATHAPLARPPVHTDRGTPSPSQPHTPADPAPAPQEPAGAAPALTAHLPTPQRAPAAPRRD